MTTIFVKGLEFYGYHGVSPEERVVGHRFRLDIRAHVHETAGLSDRVEDTVHYGELASTALEVSGRERLQTVERLCSLIAAEVLERFPSVQQVDLRLAKLVPPLEMMIEEVGVERSFNR